MDPKADAELLWIAKEGFLAPVPEPWKQCVTEQDEPYYFNTVTRTASWDHPSDEHYRNLYVEEKKKLIEKKAKEKPEPEPKPETIEGKEHKKKPAEDAKREMEMEIEV